MSLATYSELRYSVKKFTRREDIDLIFDSMIETVEDYFYPKLRVREMIFTYSAPLVIGDRTLALPPRFEEALPYGCRTVTNGERYPIEYRLNAVDDRNLSGRPQQFRVTTELEFDVKPDIAYSFEMEHFARLTKLTEAAGANAILSAYPSIYFYGLLWLTREYAVEPELAERELKKFDMAIGSANSKFKKSQFGPSPQFAGVQRQYSRSLTMRGR